jgi:hypothetical protein
MSCACAGLHLLLLVGWLVGFATSDLLMETVFISKFIYEKTWRQNPKQHKHYTNNCENLKSHTVGFIF